LTSSIFIVYLAGKFLDVKILCVESTRKYEGEELQMTPPTTIEFQRQVHEDRTALLQSSMHRPSSFRPRRTIGAWMVSTGLRLAPEERMHPRLRAGAESTEAPACAGASPFPA
jgi:hypothetical protein